MSNERKKIRTIVQGIRLIERLSPRFLLCCIGQAALKALSPFINLYLSAIMINGLLGGKDMAQILVLAGVMVALNLACGGLSSLLDRWVGLKQSILLTQFNWNLNRKMMEFSYADVESHAVQEQRERIRQMEQVNNMGLWNLILPVRAIVQSVFSILFALAAFCPVFLQGATGESGSALTDFFCSPWASVLLVVLILGNIAVSLWTVSQSTKKVFGAYAGLVPINQVYTYYLENYIDTYHSGKDIRLYRQGDLIRREMEHLLEDGRRPMKKLKGIEFRYSAIGTLAAFGMNLFLYLTVGLRALAGLFPVGNIVQYIGGISQFITGFTTLAGQLTLLTSNVEALDQILQYLGRKSSPGRLSSEQKAAAGQKSTAGQMAATGQMVTAEQMATAGQKSTAEQMVTAGQMTTAEQIVAAGQMVTAGQRSLPEQIQFSENVEIEFRNVSFTYPDTDRKALDCLSFTIRTGEKLAVVGANGSGKTTMIKLLCRLYDADEGEILVNGIDIRAYDRESYQRLFGVVFQDFQLFSFGLGQNLAGGVEYDARRAERALEEAGFGERLRTMDLETSLYKDFDSRGVEISGGEAQKIAIARALYKQAPVLVLDEPTAALDPRAEYDVYRNLHHVCENRTAIFISHRMSSCRFCQRILVLDGGRLIQEGSHEELLGEETGKYCQLWRSQEQYYK